MRKTDLSGLKFQLFLVSILFLICSGLSLFIVMNRPWVEGYLKESYGIVSEDLQSLFDTTRMGGTIADAYKQIPPKDRLMLYDAWMQEAVDNNQSPRILMQTDFELFSRRAERTLICGSTDQRKKALRFFAYGQDRRCLPILDQAKNWARRRKLHELEAEIRQTIQELRLRTAD